MVIGQLYHKFTIASSQLKSCSFIQNCLKSGLANEYIDMLNMSAITALASI